MGAFRGEKIEVSGLFRVQGNYSAGCEGPDLIFYEE